MPLYFFTVSNDDRVNSHSDGIDFPDLDSVWIEATKSTGELLREINHVVSPGPVLRMEVSDETRKPVLSLRVIAELHD
ncbi:MAG: hypothetical protein HXX15_01030 [Rhodopseudomonas sp.]|uniref:DUF6894 family protein n=1 Tax=Rhodopseudomonas sp. TaxID=1078 RepID=UPI001801B194|nr:hypothetical protein [Rhodopseudomonas sp.]NVN84643.1 hypothetical protein [Rhodopseudomonas sp.]